MNSAPDEPPVDPPTPPSPEEPPPAPSPQAQPSHAALIPPSGSSAKAAAAPDGSPGKEERNWALFAHLTTFSSYIGVPGFIGPLVIWLLKKDEMPFVDDQAKEALNFQISLFIYAIISAVLIFVLIGFFLLIALAVLHVIFTIIAAIKASEGTRYRYPLTIRLVT